jgi:energy-coupling factor transporter ATP-binding protein EcfA2
VDAVIDTLELRECEGVILGDELKRGVSGGQKKRVTVAEAMLCGGRVVALDEATNGLDAVTAVRIMRFLADWARVTGGTVVSALQAPTPEILATFDSVLLLSDGHQLFLGPPAALPAYLVGLGYACPAWMDLLDYALALCVSPAFVADTYHAGAARPALTTREALADAWRAKAASTARETAVGGISLQDPATRAQYGSRTVHPAIRQTGLLFARQGKVVRRNPAVSVGRVVQFIVLGAIFGSVYFKLPMFDLNGALNFIPKISLAIFACSAVSFATFAEIPAIFVGKRTAAKQIDGGFFGPVPYVLSIVLNALPASIISTFLFATILYW